MSEGAVAERLAALRERIASAAKRAGRDPAEVRLVGVAKRQPADAVVEAVAAGLHHVGESFAQEAREKVPEVDAKLASLGLEPPRWHFVGRLQRNKARVVVANFACVESLDRGSLARELDRRAASESRTLEVMLQVNTSGEAQKGGADPDDVAALLAEVEELPALRVTGLMTVPAAASSPEDSRPAFARLRALRDELAGAPGGAQLRALSMGMSADFEVAIEEGATHVRVGTALFGPRQTA